MMMPYVQIYSVTVTPFSGLKCELQCHTSGLKCNYDDDAICADIQRDRDALFQV